MSDIVDYEIVEGSSENVVRKVRKMIEEGWEPFGNIAVQEEVNYSMGNHRQQSYIKFAQPMVKRVLVSFKIAISEPEGDDGFTPLEDVVEDITDEGDVENRG